MHIKCNGITFHSWKFSSSNFLTQEHFKLITFKLISIFFRRPVSKVLDKVLYFILGFYDFIDSVVSLYILRKHQKTSGFAVFRGHRKRPAAWNGLIEASRYFLPISSDVHLAWRKSNKNKNQSQKLNLKLRLIQFELIVLLFESLDLLQGRYIYIILSLKVKKKKGSGYWKHGICRLQETWEVRKHKNTERRNSKIKGDTKKKYKRS